MGRRARKLDRSLGEVEESILPSLSGLLDELIDTAALARPGTDADMHATELRYTAHQLAALTRLVEAVAPLATPLAQAPSASRRMSA